MEGKWQRVFLYAVFVLVFVLVATCVFLVGRKAWLNAMDLDYRAIKRVSGLRYWCGKKDVVADMGSPDCVAYSLAELKDYPYPKIPAPVGEEILVYSEYPWGIFVYVERKKHHVTGIVMIRRL